jgi:hypothetical protein
MFSKKIFLFIFSIIFFDTYSYRFFNNTKYQLLSNDLVNPVESFRFSENINFKQDEKSIEIKLDGKNYIINLNVSTQNDGGNKGYFIFQINYDESTWQISHNVIFVSRQIIYFGDQFLGMLSVN